tara:strand:- start:2692 stop:3378 length:687 start_codon:yes stop_codon:yes gene_type:complete
LWDSLPLAWSSRTTIENLSSPDSINLFFNASGAFYEVYHSSDLGLTWYLKSQIQSPRFLYKAEFVTDSIGVYFGSNILKTIDQGVNWTYTVVNRTSYIPFSTCIQYFTEDLIYLGGDYSFLRTNNGGDTTILTGIKATSYSVELTVYPNPATGMITAESEAEIESLELFDLSGSRYNFLSHRVPLKSGGVYRSVNKKYLDLTNIKTGMYFLKVHLKVGEVVIKKLIKQ